MTGSDRLQTLADYGQQASDRFSKDWLNLAEKWTKLARQAEAAAFHTDQSAAQ